MLAPCPSRHTDPPFVPPPPTPPAPLPLLQLMFGVFTLLGFIWVYLVIKGKEHAHKIHYLIIVLVIFKSLTVLSQVCWGGRRRCLWVVGLGVGLLPFWVRCQVKVQVLEAEYLCWARCE